MIFNNPIGEEKADRIVRLLRLPTSGRALDAGCGTGEFLLRVVAHHSVSGVGVDRDLRSIATARDNAAARSLTSRCEFHAIEMSAFDAAPASFDLGICIGATHAFGEGESALPNTVARLCQLIRPGGVALIGEAYWKQPPAPEYLKLLGEPVGIYRDHAANVAFAESRGLVPLYAVVSSDDEWDDFEWRHHQKTLREAQINPADPNLFAKLQRAREWRDGYLRWGRAAMGFGLYLFRVRQQPSLGK